MAQRSGGVAQYVVDGEDVARKAGFLKKCALSTGAIRKYYNYFRVTPMTEPLDALGRLWQVTDERAEPGWYQPVPRGLEIRIGEKLAQLRQWDRDAGND